MKSAGHKFFWRLLPAGVDVYASPTYPGQAQFACSWISSVRSLRYFRYKQDDFRHYRNSVTLRTTTFFFEVNVRGKLLIDGFGYIYNVCTTSMSCARSNNSIHITMRLGLAGHFGYPRRRCRPYPLVRLPQCVMCTRPTATLFFGGVFPIWR